MTSSWPWMLCNYQNTQGSFFVVSDLASSFHKCFTKLRNGNITKSCLYKILGLHKYHCNTVYTVHNFHNHPTQLFFCMVLQPFLLYLEHTTYVPTIMISTKTIVLTFPQLLITDTGVLWWGCNSSRSFLWIGLFPCLKQAHKVKGFLILWFLYYMIYIMYSMWYIYLFHFHVKINW